MIKPISTLIEIDGEIKRITFDYDTFKNLVIQIIRESDKAAEQELIKRILEDEEDCPHLHKEAMSHSDNIEVCKDCGKILE